MGLLFFRQALVSRGSTTLGLSPYIGRFLRDCLVLRREIPRFTAFYNGLSTVKEGPFPVLYPPFEQVNYGFFRLFFAGLFMTNLYTSPYSPDYLFSLVREVGRSWADYRFLTA